MREYDTPITLSRLRGCAQLNSSAIRMGLEDFWLKTLAKAQPPGSRLPCQTGSCGVSKVSTDATQVSLLVALVAVRLVD